MPQPQPSEPPPAAEASPEGYQVAAVADGGSIAGIISVSGSIPVLPGRPINKDTAVCGTGARLSQELLVSKSGGLRNAVVIVEGVRRGKAMPLLKPTIDQVGCEYAPHVQVMAQNTDLSIVNSDPILHNIHVYQGDADLFNVAQPIKGQTNTHRIEKPGFIYAECDVHGWMRGHVAVVDNPYYAVTDEQGRFEITDLPPGNYSVRVRHEYLGEQVRQVAVSAKGIVPLNLDLNDLLQKKNLSTSAATPAAPPAATVPKTAAAADKAPAATSGAKALSGNVTINMISNGGTFAFEPRNVTVRAGTAVTWVNTSDNRHSATDDPKFEKAPGQAVLPNGVEPWSTPFIANGQETSHTFTTPGKYQYFCRNHGQFGMVATVTVVP